MTGTHEEYDLLETLYQRRLISTRQYNAWFYYRQGWTQRETAAHLLCDYTTVCRDLSAVRKALSDIGYEREEGAALLGIPLKKGVPDKEGGTKYLRTDTTLAGAIERIRRRLIKEWRELPPEERDGRRRRRARKEKTDE